MTLLRHSFLLKAGITAASVLVAGIAALSSKILPFYPVLVSAAVRRTEITQLITPSFPPSSYAAFFTMAVPVLYALVLLILLFYFFEKTQAVEGHFFIFFMFSFIGEALRIVLPLRSLFALPSFCLSLSAHCLAFCRYFGIFSFFCAALVTAGLKVEKEENILFPLLIITMFISYRLPVNIYNWDTSLCLLNGHPLITKSLELIVSALTVLSFICGALKRAVKEYYVIALGALLILAGRALLLGSDNYLLPALGLTLLAAGSYYVCVYLRRIYLWA